MRWAALLALAACGGSTPAPAPTPVTVTIDAAPGPDLEGELTRLGAIVDQACACQDLPCFEEADRAMASYFDVMTWDNDATVDDPWPKALSDRRIALANRMVGCFQAGGAKLVSSVDHYALRRLEHHADRACACTTDACRVELRDAVASFDDQPSSALEAPGLADRFRGALTTLARCLAPVLEDHVADVLAAAQQQRDVACACTDAGCAQRAAADLLAWLRLRGTLALVAAMNQPVLDAFDEIGRCSKAKP